MDTARSWSTITDNWKVQVSDQRLPRSNRMKCVLPSNTYPSGDTVFSEDTMYVENRCEDKKNVDKWESQLNVNENVWANIPIDIEIVQKKITLPKILI